MTLKISLKLTFLSLALVVFTSLILFHFANQEMQSVLRKRILSEFAITTDFYIQKVEQYNQLHLQNIRFLASDFLIERYFLYIDSLSEHLGQLQKFDSAYVDLTVYDTLYQEVASSQKVLSNHLQQVEFLKQVDREGTYWITELDSLNVVCYAVPIYHDYKKVGFFTGVITAQEISHLFDVNPMIEMSEISPLITDSIKIFLVDSSDIIIYSNEYAAGTSLRQENIILKKLKQNPVYYYETKSKLYFYARFHKDVNGWQLIMSIPTSIAFRPLIEIRKKFTYISVIVVAVAGIIGYLTSRRFSRPIRRLAIVADQVASGNFDAPIQVETHDEIGYLAKHFKVMAANIKKRVKEIQQQKAQIETQKQELERAYRELDYKNKQTLASINYAKKIQASMMPDVLKLTQYFEDAFVLYLPKDIVSGDIYWFDVVSDKHTNREYLMIAVMDCTGHGVPGAVMSILGSNLMTNIVTYGRKTDLEKVLTALHANIVQILHQADTPDNSQDGMEIALVSLDLESKKLKFAGCGRPLWIIRNGELHEIEGNKITVGGISKISLKKAEKFTDFAVQIHEISLVKGDYLYLFSDGYKDQIGQERKKFSNKRFKEILLQIHKLPMHEQQAWLEAELRKWQGDEKQTDDILVLGINV
ncbi:MAG: SpoIIE family protein phosphatase [Cytophagales bacterium]|nr:SpoIIE family protein phosphatase [Cytophagales bacterium]MDW8383701.1 SpoIIE family protein phosphatase [Flammeovirgaceae bacterium]